MIASIKHGQSCISKYGSIGMKKHGCNISPVILECIYWNDVDKKKVHDQGINDWTYQQRQIHPHIA